MPISRDSRQIREWKLIRRSQFRLRQGLDRIRWEEEELIPEVEALLSGKSVAGLPEGSTFDIVIESTHANPDPSPSGPDRTE